MTFLPRGERRQVTFLPKAGGRGAGYRRKTPVLVFVSLVGLFTELSHICRKGLEPTWNTLERSFGRIFHVAFCQHQMRRMDAHPLAIAYLFCNLFFWLLFFASFKSNAMKRTEIAQLPFKTMSELEDLFQAHGHHRLILSSLSTLQVSDFIFLMETLMAMK